MKNNSKYSINLCPAEEMYSFASWEFFFFECLLIFFSKLTCKKIFKNIIRVSSSLDPDLAPIFCRGRSGVLSWADNTSRQEHYSLQSSLINRGSYMSAHVFLNLSNELGEKRKNVRLAEHFISFSQWVNTRAQMLDDIKITLKSHFCHKFCLIWFFTSSQQSFSYKGMDLPGSNQY